MKLNEAIKTLQTYNDWRVGNEISVPEPKKITEDTDILLNIFEKMNQENVPKDIQDILNEKFLELF